MCGVAGVVRFDRPGTASLAEARAMRDRLRHRGPDGEGDVALSHAALAHARLAMLDREGGAQPITDGRYTLVFNGELYDHEALRARLPGPWRTRGDAETLLAAWACWGEACLERLDGMFALFVWDETTRTGFAARDRLGVKPLAFRVDDDGGFAFASEARALAGERPRPDVEAIVEHLVAPCFSGVARSPFAGVRHLAPGHVLRVDARGVSSRPFWRWSFSTGEPPDARAMREAFATAVRAAARADVPLGAFLSGGLDSTAILAIARLRSWTITFDGQGAWDHRTSALVVSDDTPWAERAARELGVAWDEVRFDRATLGRELAALAAANDAIPAWEQELSQRALARAASRHVKGVLVGDAADETHFGYHFLLDETATRSPAAILRRLGSVPVRRDVDPDPVARLDAEYRALAEDAGATWSSPRDRVLATTHLVVRRWLPRLLHNGDVHTMAFGLEARVPFASARVLDLAARVPPEIGLAGGVEKSFLREALRGLVPEAIRTRRKSALPKDQDVAAIYREEARAVLVEPHPVVRGVVDLDALAPLLAGGPMREAERAQLFRVVCLHHWARAHAVTAP